MNQKINAYRFEDDQVIYYHCPTILERWKKDPKLFFFFLWRLFTWSKYKIDYEVIN